MNENLSQNRFRWKLGVTAFLVAAVAVVCLLSDDLLPLFIAFGLAYAFSPLVDWLARRKVSRTWSTVGILVVLGGLVTLLVATLVPLVVSETQDFIHNFPDLLGTALHRVSTFARGFGIAIPSNVDALVDRLRGQVQKGNMESINPAVNAARHFLSSAVGVLISFLNLLVIPIFFFYVCRDLPQARSYVYALIPPRRQPYARDLYFRVDRVLSGYIRGQMSVAAILGVIFSISLVALGVPFGLFIGILSGFLNMVPFVGQITGLVLAVLMAVVDYHGAGHIIAICCLFAATNFLEGHFLSPKIVGENVGLSPLWVIIALIVGGKAGGLLGMMLAVPTAGVIKVLLTEILERYRASAFYRVAEPVHHEKSRPASRHD